MLRSGVRLLIWLLVVCIPAQATVAVTLRAKGPAHAHVEVSRAGQLSAQWGPHSNGDDGDDEAAHAAWHAREHEGSRAAHHHHDESDESVVPVADSGDDELGAGGATVKVSAIDMPGLLSSALSGQCALARLELSTVAPLAFDSITAVPLYRPPR